MSCVREFHLKHGFPVDITIPSDEREELKHAALVLNSLSDLLEEVAAKDPRLLRAHLMIEELGESIAAMNRGDELGLLDGLCDLNYVVMGTAETFGLPLEEGTKEVHRSNMTKAIRKDGDTRLRNKGDSYEAPNLRQVLADSRMSNG